MAAYRCSTCGVCWPLRREYKDCPACGERCWAGPNITPMDAAEAESLRKHVLFERFYAEREQRNPLVIGD